VHKTKSKNKTESKIQKQNRKQKPKTTQTKKPESIENNLEASTNITSVQAQSTNKAAKIYDKIQLEINQ